MARRKRFHHPSTTYHVMLRGNNGQPIFFSDADRCKMCLLIQEGVERFGHRIFSFCLMKNHIHLALQVEEVKVSRIIQNLAFRYTRYLNKKMNRIGHLFQGRFKSIVVEEERYLKELIRYIHLNPVRARMVESPMDFAWSSHRTYMNSNNLTWLNSDYLLSRFGDNKRDALVAFNRFVLDGLKVKKNIDFEDGCRKGVLGSDDFVKNVLENIQVLDKQKVNLIDLTSYVCKKYQVTQEDLVSPLRQWKLSHVRSVLALMVREIDHLSLEDLGHLLKRESSGLSKLARRIEEKSAKSPDVQLEIETIRAELVTF